MNERIRRMQRLAELAERHERLARRSLGQAITDRDSAAVALQSVFIQCREVAERPDEFGVRFGRGLIESGWLAEQERRSALESAIENTEDRRHEWSEQRTRVDALDRMLDRLHEAHVKDVARREESELNDLVSSRLVVRGAA